MRLTSGRPRSGMLPELLIALSVCVGAHFFAVDPLKQRLRETQTKVNALVDESREAGKLGADLPRVAQILAQTSAQADTIHRLSRDATDESALFTAITNLAVEHNVRIDQLDPREPTQDPAAAPQGGQPQGAAGAPARRPGERVLAYTISATARYADLTSFIDALTARLGYTSIYSVRIEPTYDPTIPTVLATIITQHYAFDASPLVTATPDGAPAPPSTPP